MKVVSFVVFVWFDLLIFKNIIICLLNLNRSLIIVLEYKDIGDIGVDVRELMGVREIGN